MRACVGEKDSSAITWNIHGTETKDANTCDKDKHTGERKYQGKKVSLSEEFASLCEMGDLTHTRLTHKQSSFPRNPEQEQGRLQENYPHPQDPDCCSLQQEISAKKTLRARPRHSHSSYSKSTATVLNVNTPWRAIPQSGRVCTGRELFFSQGDIFLIQVSDHNYSGSDF